MPGSINREHCEATTSSRADDCHRGDESVERKNTLTTKVRGDVPDDDDAPVEVDAGEAQDDDDGSLFPPGYLQALRDEWPD